MNAIRFKDCDRGPPVLNSLRLNLQISLLNNLFNIL